MSDTLSVSLVTYEDFERYSSPLYEVTLKDATKMKVSRVPHIIYHAVPFWPTCEFDIIVQLPRASVPFGVAQKLGEPLTTASEAKDALIRAFDILI